MFQKMELNLTKEDHHRSIQLMPSGPIFNHNHNNRSFVISLGHGTEAPGRYT